MAYYYGYPYPPYYVPEPWRTTSVPHHYPEKHYPLEGFRHAVGHTISNVAHALDSTQPIFSPSIDIRESLKNYYIDIEVPGLETKNDLRIRWTSLRTLLVETRIERPKIDEDEVEVVVEQTAGTNDGNDATEPSQTDGKPTQSDEADGPKKDESSQEKHDDIALTVHERRIGAIARAFSFPTKVNHETLEASVHAGLLRLKVPKIETDEIKPEHREVDVKHSGQ